MNKYDKLKSLGSNSTIANEPQNAILEKIDNPASTSDYCIRFTCPEFTSICPKTQQPDFAFIMIDYIPNKHIVESKSLKQFLQSFRNHGAFHEECTMYIAQRLVELLNPQWLRLGGYWYPRGGIPIDIFYQTGEAPKHVWTPEQNISSYRGRG